MNKKWVLFHLREASEELERAISELTNDPEYGEGEFFPAMQHLYHHVNTAWNARRATDAEAEPGSDDQWNAWGEFPADFPLMRV